ncbi:MAG: COX15/CtaA family protein [Ilumatobacter sp.]|uniref:COX15/CtaA family protein n=1 Tax=Ilumatobacter sp. TaxID=1967498 RepID=UPI003C78C690
MTLARYRQLAIVTTVGICVLVVAGGVVRLTGSGLGCDDWPNCNAERFIDVSTGHAAIEQVNRLLSGLIGLPTLLLAIVSFRAAPRGSGLRWPAIGVLASVLANGVVGGIAVRGDLHPALVQSHFLLAMISIAFGLVAIRASSGRRIEWSGALGLDSALRTKLVSALTVVTAAALVTGTVVTGAGPHAGEQDVRRFGFDISQVARLHSGTVIIAVAIGAALALSLAQAGDVSVRNAVSSWMFVAILQGGIGYAQYFTGVPELLVGTHIAGATLLWVVTVRLFLTDVDATQEHASVARNAMDSKRLHV